MVLEFEVLGFEFKNFRDDLLLAVPKVNIEKLDCRLTEIVCILLKQIISFIHFFIHFKMATEQLPV